MRDILQIIGVVFAVIIVIIVDGGAVMKFKSSKKDQLAENRLFEGVIIGSALAIVVLIIFLLISELF